MADDTRRGTGDGVARVSPAVVLALLAVAGAVVGGVAFAQSSAPSGETIVERAHQRYAHAETVTGAATVTVSNDSANRTAEVGFAAAEPNASRVSIEPGGENGTTLLAGTNGTVAWVAAPEYGFVRTANRSNPNATAVCAPPDATTLAAPVPAANGSDGDTDGEHDWNGSAWLATHTNGTYTDWRAACEAAVANWSTVGHHGDDAGDGDGDASAAGDGATPAPTPTPTDWDWTDNVTATRTGTEAVNGTEAYVVDLAPVDESVDVRGTAWVATEDYRLVRLRWTDGTNATDVAYRDQAFNVSIHESTFRPPTATADVYDAERYDSYATLQDATALSLPRLSADGFAFEAGAVTTYRGETTVGQSYANDTATVSLVTTDADDLPYDEVNGTAVSVDGREATAATVRDRTVVFWTVEGDDGTVTHAVVSDLSVEATVDLARTVETDDRG